MRRRALILALGAAAALPRSARAQHPDKIWRMGFLAHGHRRFYDAMFEALSELGYVEGRNLVVERRYAEGRAERFEEFATEMVRLKVDIIVVVTTPAGLAAKKATQTIPIVHPNAIDPVGSGLVASLAHPGGNVTGLAVLNAELSAKRLEIIKEAVPGIAYCAVLGNAANPALALAWGETERGAGALDVKLRLYKLRGPSDFEEAFSAIARERPDFLIVFQDALTVQHRPGIIDFASRQRLPSMFVGREWVEEGGLMSYGDRLPERYRSAAVLVDRILKGEKPADLPVEQPTKFELVINLKTARALGVAIPPGFLVAADEVIE